MKKLTKYLKGYIKETILGPLFKLFEATLELIVPLIIASIIDVGIESGNKGHIALMCGLLVLLGFVGLGFSLTAQYFAAKASVGFVTGVKRGLYKHLQSLSYSDMDRIGTSTMITRMTADASKVQTGLNLTLRLLLRSPFVVFGAMIMAFSIDREAGINFGLTILGLSIIVFGVMLITMPMYKKVQGGVDKILSKTRENLAGVRVIRAFGMENSELSEFKNENSALTRSGVRAGSVSALMNPLTYVIINVGIIVLIGSGAVKVDSGELTQGQVIALYNYMSQILVELVKLANLIVSVSKALASAARISSIFDITPSQKFGTKTDGINSENSVEFSNVCLSYNESGEKSLEDISFTVKKGETIGIIGGTGSGKTSLINLIPRFYDATEGNVKINGVNVTDYSREALINKISIVPQRAVLFSGTIRDNMKWGKTDATDEEILQAIKSAQAADVVNAKGGLDSRIEAGGSNLSGGQRQRLTIARALVGNPEILILDDSASALDYATDAALRASIRELPGDKTVFIVSQRAASVMHADRIIVLEDGHTVGIGAHTDLMNTCSVYREIYDSQFRSEVS
ncbi:MAG: ABC transporter ATP-binding protein [Clostridia bacterium]|nr:ABC transporter ATP-binding protein [Clostridia bacterium]